MSAASLQETEANTKAITMESSATLLMGYAILCFVTSIILNMGSGQPLTATLGKEGGEVGPVVVEKAGEVYQVEINQPLKAYDIWSFVDGEVLNEEKEFLFGFGDEVWSESGYDDEGSWYEKKEDFSHNVTFPEAGTYYLNFKSETSSQGSVDGVQVRVQKLVGASLAHFWIGMISFIAAISLWWMASNTRADYQGVSFFKEYDDDD